MHSTFQVPQVDLTSMEVILLYFEVSKQKKKCFCRSFLQKAHCCLYPETFYFLNNTFYMGFYSILDPPENVQLMTNATASKACQNDVVSFMCSADAVPSAMSFQLFKDNVPMETSDSGMWAKPLLEGGVFAYKCVANNSIGSASSANVSITVNGK